MRIEAHGMSHPGLVRPSNEDALLCRPTVFAVADGLGGLPAGEIASKLAVAALGDLDGRRHADAAQAAEALVEGVGQANRAVLIDARAHPAHVGMATTLTAATVHEDQLLLAHVGDSRAYLLREGRLRQLTRDHNPPGRPHVLSRVIGEHGVEVDRPDPVALVPGDCVLLATDGLEVVAERDVVRILAGAGTAAAACEQLVEATLDAGAPDNVTVVVALVGQRS